MSALRRARNTFHEKRFFGSFFQEKKNRAANGSPEDESEEKLSVKRFKLREQRGNLCFHDFVGKLTGAYRLVSAAAIA